MLEFFQTIFLLCKLDKDSSESYLYYILSS